MFWACLLPSVVSVHPVSGCSHEMQSAIKWDKVDGCLNLLCCIPTRDFGFFPCMLVLSSHCISLATTLHVRVMTVGLQSKPHFLSLICSLKNTSSQHSWVKGVLSLQVENRSSSLQAESYTSRNLSLHFPQSDKWAQPEGCYHLGFSSSSIFLIWKFHLYQSMYTSIKKLWFW